MRLIVILCLSVVLASCKSDTTNEESRFVLQTAFETLVEEDPAVSASLKRIDSIFIIPGQLSSFEFYNNKYNIITAEIFHFNHFADKLEYPKVEIIDYIPEGNYLDYKPNSRIILEIFPIIETKEGYQVEIVWAISKHACGGYLYIFEKIDGIIILQKRVATRIC